MNCPICNKHFSRVSNLNKHRRTSQCSKINACPDCRQCFITNMSEHAPNCAHTLLKRNIELERQISEYIDKCITRNCITCKKDGMIERKSIRNNNLYEDENNCYFIE